MSHDGLQGRRADPIEVGVLSRYERPLPEVGQYDQLLGQEGVS